jgi:hypothetical protein
MLFIRQSTTELLNQHHISNDQRPDLEKNIYSSLLEVEKQSSLATNPSAQEKPDKVSLPNISAAMNVISEHIAKQPQYIAWKDQELGLAMSKLLDDTDIKEEKNRDYLLPLLFGRSNGEKVDESTLGEFKQELINFKNAYSPSQNRNEGR